MTTCTSSVSSGTVDTWVADWQRWHRQREAAAAEPHGTAALTTTTWLDESPRAVDGLPGLWAAFGDTIVSSQLAENVSVEVGAEVAFGELVLRAIRREGVAALRVFDPAAPRRVALRGIGAFGPDPAWVLQGTFQPADAGSEIQIAHVDGLVSADALAGTVRFTVAGHDAALAAFPAAGGGLQITFADTTNGSGTRQFRFLTLPAPDADGNVTVDFNRAYLPPCAFSDHYLCPIPPSQNRLPLAVSAGETHPLT